MADDAEHGTSSPYRPGAGSSARSAAAGRATVSAERNRGSRSGVWEVMKRIAVVAALVALLASGCACSGGRGSHSAPGAARVESDSSDTTARVQQPPTPGPTLAATAAVTSTATASTTASATASSTAVALPMLCPVEREICVFAVETTAQLEAGDYAAVARGSLQQPQLLEQSRRMLLGTYAARLVSIVCRYPKEPGECGRQFGLVLTILDDDADWTGMNGILLLTYDRLISGPTLTGMTGVDPAAVRRQALAGGPANNCRILRRWDIAECPDVMFYPVGPGAPFQPRELPSAPKLIIGEPATLPRASLLLATDGCYGCEGHATGGYRAITGKDGRTLLEPIDLSALRGTLGGMTGAPDGSIAIAWTYQGSGGCTIGLRAGPDLVTTVYRSRDGAVRWEPMDVLAGCQWFRVAEGGRILAQGFGPFGESPTTAPPYQWLNPSGTLVAPPGWESGWTAFLTRGSFDWRPSDGHALLDARGGVVRDFGARASLWSATSLGDHLLVTWTENDGSPTARGSHTRNLLTAIDPSGATIWELEVDFDAFFGVGFPITATTSLGAVKSPAGGSRPAIFDLATRSVHPLGGPFETHGGRNGTFALVTGPLLRVRGTGDCLNLRTAPSLSGAVVTCLVDGAFVRDGAEEVTADGVTWRSAAMLDGTPAWAASEYLHPLP